MTIIRPFNTYGPRQSNRAIIPTIITQLISNKKKISLGSLYPTRDFSYIFDTIRGFELAINNTKVVGEIINIGSGFEISINDLFQTLCKIMKKSPKIVTDSNRVRPKKVRYLDLKRIIEKQIKYLNRPIYKGKNGLIKGLKETVEWYSDERNLLKYKTDHYVK